MSLSENDRAAEIAIEPLLQEEPGRHTILPLRYHVAWKWYKVIEGLLWPAQDADLSTDSMHWKNVLSAGDRAFYKPIFGVFGPGDEKITENLDRFLKLFKVKEMRFFYDIQGVNEHAHSEAYSLQITAIFSDEEQDELFNSIETMPIVGKMMRWVDKWIASSEPVGTCMTAFAFFEGGIFQGLFMAIQLLKERNVMPGVTMLNELISRDEGVHCKAACEILQAYIVNKPTKKRVHQIMQEAVSLFDELIDTCCNAAREAMGLPANAPCPVKMVTEKDMKQYARFIFDQVAIDLGYSALFQVENPYPESVKLSLNGVQKTNFFEHLPTQYSVVIDYSFNASLKNVRLTSLGKPKRGFKSVLPKCSASLLRMAA